MEPIKCTKCKKDKDETEFGFYRNKRRKYCITCTDKRNSHKCPHNREKSHCKECGGVGICEHNKRKKDCKECGGSQICEHQRVRSTCKECGGSQICEHNRRIMICKECGGSGICEHNKRKTQCKQCSPLQVLINIQRKSLQRVLKRSDLSKTKATIEYLGCSAEHFMEYLKLKMTPDMTMDNIHIDHIKPVSRFNLDDPDEFLDCCHYTNLQPLLAKDNMEKGNKWTEKDEIYWKENIRGLETTEIYLT
jgi:hypothetical protein